MSLQHLHCNTTATNTHGTTLSTHTETKISLQHTLEKRVHNIPTHQQATPKSTHTWSWFLGAPHQTPLVHNQKLAAIARPWPDVRSGIRIILYALRHWSPQPVVWNGRVWRVHSNGRWPEDSFSSVLFFSSVLIVNKWSVMFPRCTTTFHSDGLVNWLCECDFWIGIRSGRHFISSRGGFSWRLFWQTLQRSRSAGPSMLLRYGQCTS